MTDEFSQEKICEILQKIVRAARDGGSSGWHLPVRRRDHLVV
jgi:hypothetical protein